MHDHPALDSADPTRPQFVHLRLHSEFSVVDGTVRVGDAATAAARDGQGALALTDLSNLFGAIKFYKACRGAGVKPILGADVWVEAPEGADSRGFVASGRLLLLAQNTRGYLNLCDLLSRGWLAAAPPAGGGVSASAGRQPALLKWGWLEQCAEGLICLSGADAGLVGQALAAGDEARAEALALRLAALFDGGRFFIELQRAGAPQHEAHVQAAVPLAARLKLPVVATHPIQFLEREDFLAHEARVCVAEGETLANPRRVRRFTEAQHFRTQAQMAECFADLPSALANSVVIAERCNLSLVLGKNQLPDFPTPEANGQRQPLEAYFREQSHAGLERRLAALFPDRVERDAQRPKYVDRLEFEIATIVKMGFPGYFMIVSDFIVWAKAHGCPVGPGRGSGAGSLVAYALSITDLDPLRYGLLFERFLNPERVSMPDFDIDFCQANRDRVIEYVKAKYGREAVSQIATFGTMAAKAALRDVGRVLGMGYGQVDSIAKLVPGAPGKTYTLAKLPADPKDMDPGLIYVRKEVPELEAREAAEVEVAELLELATRVEGLVRNIGMHAGGVLIAPGRITDFSPLYQQPGSDSAVSQFDKDDVEAAGLVKFDFLGLATLTILELAKDFIRARRKGREAFDYDQVPLDDPRVYKLFAEARTEAVFQFESSGMKGMLRDAQPTRLEDLFALNAMFRPGPMDNIPTFCARKHGREEVAYPHPALEAVLGETYGIFVYQEQVMQAAQVLGGYSLGGADLLRRAMGKKKPEEMAKERIKFLAGAKDKGIAEEVATQVFDDMEKFAGYGFNKSHAAAYSVLAYHTAWVKVHCAAEFYAANMTVEADNTDKLRVLLADARHEGIAFEPPDINRGVFRFEPVTDKLVRYGLGAVKGTGQGAIEAIVAAREGTGAHAGEGGGPFRSLFDFCVRVDRKAVSKRVVEVLIKAGAFDSLHPDRAALVASVGLAFDWADTQEANALQGGLFDFGDEGVAHGSSQQEPALAHVPPWDLAEKLGQEKLALGFHLSGHLFDIWRDEVRRFARVPIAELPDLREPQLVAGVVGGVRFVPTARGRLAIFTLDDSSETIEVSIDEDSLGEGKAHIVEDQLLLCQGKVVPDRRSGGKRLNLQQWWPLASARARFGRYLAVDQSSATPPPVAEVLKLWPARRIDDEHGERRQGLPVRLRIKRGGATAELDLGDDSRFWPCDEALGRWRGIAAAGQAVVVYE
jgi:DNA polymerase-3 subunit alpha